MRWSALILPAVSIALSGCERSADPNANANTGAEANLSAPAAASAPAHAANGRQYVELAGGTALYAAEVARLALEKSQSAGVRALAEAILANHDRAMAQLSEAAAQAQPPIAFAPELNAAQQASLTQLRGATGEAFDRLWIEQQVETYQQAMNLTTDFAANGDAPSLRNHAATAAGPLLVQLSQARTLAEGAVARDADNAAAPAGE